MTLTIDLELSADKEQALRVGIKEKDVQRVRALLVQALEPAVEKLLGQGDDVSGEAFDALLDDLAKTLADDGSSKFDYSSEKFDRAAFYAGHA